MRSRMVALFTSLVASACVGDGDAAAPAPFGRVSPSVEAPIGAPIGAPATASSARALPLIAPPYDVVTTHGALDLWPLLVPGIEARAITSHDRSGGNDDGFTGAHSELYEDVRGEHVVFDAVGPGVLRTLWFTSNVDGNGPLPEKRLRFYFDDEGVPRIEIDANALYAGKTAPFVTPLVADNQSSSGGFASWAPLVFARRLRITTEVRAGFYQAHYETLPPDWGVESTRPDEAAAGLVDRFSRTDFSTLPLSVEPLDTTKVGAGIIDVLRFEPSAAVTTEQLRTARIRITFDASPTPQVDVPLGIFFGSGLGETTVRAVPWTMAPGRYESRFPMPYWEKVRVEVIGLAGQLSLHVSGPRTPREETGTFEVVFHETKLTTPGVDFEYADVTGAGKLVGTVLVVEPPLASSKQWWEGDLRSTVDDLVTPAISGTGHEDDHLGGWSNEFLERPFSRPMQGCPKTELLEHIPGTQYNANATMYRLFPGIPFLRRIRHVTEHGPSNTREAAYGSATFLYRQHRDRLVRSDAVAIGEADRDKVQSFRLAIAPVNAGVKLRRAFDMGRGITRALVEVDGTRVGAWSVVDRPRPGVTAERDFFIPPQLTRGKSSLEIRLVPQGPFDTARLETWSVLP